MLMPEPAIARVPTKTFADAPALILGPDGRTYINPGKEAQQAWIANLNDNPVELGAGATRDFELQARAEAGRRGDLQIGQIVCDVSPANHPFRATIYSLLLDKAFSSAPVHSECFAGTAGFPFVLPCAFWVEAGGFAQVKLENLSSTQALTIRLGFIGWKYMGYGETPWAPTKDEVYQHMATRRWHPFWLSTITSPFSLTANQTSSMQTLQVPGECDLLCHGILIRRECATRFNLLKSRSGAPLFENKMPDTLVAGDARTPFLFPFKHLFKRNTQIVLDIDEVDGVGGSVFFYLLCTALYDDEPDERTLRTIALPYGTQALPTVPVQYPYSLR